jgi:hypothetical protein
MIHKSITYRLGTLLIVLAIGPMVLTTLCVSAAHGQTQTASPSMPSGELAQIAAVYKIDIAEAELTFPVSTTWG